MYKNKISLCYLIMLLGQVAHIFEEVRGKFWLVNTIGSGWFLFVNWLLLLIPFIFFYFVLLDKRWAYYLSIIYAGIMILNGIVHNIVTLVTGRYFNGFAGGFSGIIFIVIGPFLIYYLLKGMPNEFKSA